MEKDLSLKLHKGRVTTITSMLLHQREIKEEKLLKSIEMKRKGKKYDKMYY